MRQAFLWREHRTADKSGLFSLFGRRYQVSARVAGRRLEIRYDPESLEELEVWLDGNFVERVRPFCVHAHRRPPQHEARIDDEVGTCDGDKPAKGADWLRHLVERCSTELFDEPTPRQLADLARQRREETDEALRDVLRDNLDLDAYSDDDVDAYLHRYGPLDAETAAQTLQRLFDAGEARDLRVSHYLDAEDRFSVLIAGTEEILATLHAPSLAPLRSRVAYAHALRPFGIEDARDYVKHHLLNADCDRNLFSDKAIQHLFHASKGCPRSLNQLALQILINAAMENRHDVDQRYVKAQIAIHPLFQPSAGD